MKNVVFLQFIDILINRGNTAAIKQWKPKIIWPTTVNSGACKCYFILLPQIIACNSWGYPFEFIILIIVVSVPKLLKLKANCEHVLCYNYSICLCDKRMWPVSYLSTFMSSGRHEDVHAVLRSMCIFIINGVTDLSLYLSPDSVGIPQWHTLEQTNSTHSLWATCRPWHRVMLSIKTYEIQKHILTLPLAKARQNTEVTSPIF